jgi:hypothetical protein
VVYRRGLVGNKFWAYSDRRRSGQEKGREEREIREREGRGRKEGEGG